MENLNYLAEKIKAAKITEYPFRHVYIEDFFSDEHFEELTSSKEIKLRQCEDDEDVISALVEQNYEIITFPGTVNDAKSYLAWRRKKKRSKTAKTSPTCSSFGVVFRLKDATTPLISDINDFLKSKLFNEAIAAKFGLDFEQLTVDTGIQKYLDGYEISPHPDVRRKAATFMVNINPAERSEELNYHTQYLQIKSEREYLLSLWEGNPRIERGWMPWDWAETKFTQTANNSIVLFSPSNTTLHAVKAEYPHYNTQRTQLYGNLWFKETKADLKLEWPLTDLLNQTEKSVSLRNKVLHRLGLR